MKLAYSLYVILLGFVSSVLCQQCSGKNYRILGGSGSVGAPDNVEPAESCSWQFDFPTRDKLLVLKFTEIKLYYTYHYFYSCGRFRCRRNGNRCSQTLSIENYNRECRFTTDICFKRYIDPVCSEAAAKLPQCTAINWDDLPIIVDFNSEGLTEKRGYEYVSNNAKGFKLAYSYIDCIQEQTTTKATTTQSSTTTSIPATTQTSTTIFIPTTTTQIPATPDVPWPTTQVTGQPENSALSTTLSSEQTYSTGMTENEPLSDSNSTTIIAIVISSLILILLLAVLLVVIAIRRRNRNEIPGPSEENEYQEFGTGESADGAVYYMAQDNIEVGPTHQAADETDQNTYSSITAPNQSEIATYSTLNLDHVASQSTSRAQDIDQSTYSTLDHEGRLSQSQPPFSATSQSEASVYSAVSREPGARKVTVRYKVSNNPDSDQQAGQEMVDNVLYESR